MGGYRYDAQTGARGDLDKMTVAGAGQLADAAGKIQAKLDGDWRGDRPRAGNGQGRVQR